MRGLTRDVLTAEASVEESHGKLGRSESAPAVSTSVDTHGTETANDTGETANDTGEMLPDLWVGALPQNHADEARMKKVFEKFGAVTLVYCQSKPGVTGTTEPQSWAYITFAGSAEAKKQAVTAALRQPILVETEQHTQVELKVEKPDHRFFKKVASNLWNHMSRVTGARALNLKQSAISADSVEGARKLMYEICFTALNARYVEMGACIHTVSFQTFI